MLDEILDDEARFREHQRRRRAGRLDAHDGRFAQRVHLFQRGGREHGLALVGEQGVGMLELFEEPEDALGAGFFEPKKCGGVCEYGGGGFGGVGGLGEHVWDTGSWVMCRCVFV